ncbi:hypothetical protein LUZ60_008486 [Juncus effusus]|nr:hypothetical protein LUZ60_008486 [Juncus effusus]
MMGNSWCCMKPPVPNDIHPEKSTTNTDTQGKEGSRHKENKRLGPMNLRGQQQFTVDQLVIITNNYAKSIGEGGFGVVYYGKVGNDEVAVKMLSKSTAHAYKQFHAEAETLSKVHHRNLVRLMGYCNEENNMAIVYEYIHHGSLYDHLRGTTEITSALNWSRRLKIAHGAAQGLNYVHSGCKMVHRDVKTANILLDKDLVAKVADFGLTREFDDFAKTMTLCGTPGYFDPQIEITGRFNNKTDVYSFGVVLLELMTGKPPCFKNEQGNNIHLSSYVSHKLVMDESVSGLVDPRIGEYNEESMKRYAKLAMRCTKRDQMKRPSMAYVVVQLQDCLNLETASEEKREIAAKSQSENVSDEKREIGENGMSQSENATEEKREIGENNISQRDNASEEKRESVANDMSLGDLIEMSENDASSSTIMSEE